LRKALIDDSFIHPDGCRGLTWLIEPTTEDWPSIAKASSKAIALELQMQPIGVPGLLLVEEKILIDGSTEETQRFALAPDTAAALFSHWQALRWGDDED
jgi:hypothetical protein